MKKQTTLLTIVIFVFICSTVLATGFMGAPSAELGKGKWSAGTDYSYSKMSLRLNEGFSTASGKVASHTIKRFKLDTVTGKVGYGVTDRWDLFVRAGMASGRWDERGERFTTDNGCVFGFGTRFTLYQQNEKTKWGGLFQIDWYSLEGNLRGNSFVGNTQLELKEMMFGFGPTYQWTSNLALYGGPFIRSLDGEKTYKDLTGSERETFDVDSETYCGGYVGTRWNLTANAVFNIEYLFTTQNGILGMNMMWLF